MSIFILGKLKDREPPELPLQVNQQCPLTSAIIGCFFGNGNIMGMAFF